MKFRVTPLVASLLAATLPALPGISRAAEHSQIRLHDPDGKGHIILAPGSLIPHTGNDPAIDVSGAGNIVEGDQVTISAEPASQSASVRASAGGRVTLTNSTVTARNNPQGQGSHALHAQGTGSIIDASDTNLSLNASYSHGAYAQDGGKIVLRVGAVSTGGGNASALHANGPGSTIEAGRLTIATSGDLASGVVAGLGGAITLTNAQIKTTGDMAHGLQTQGRDGFISVRDTDVSAADGAGAYLEGGRLEMHGGTLTSAMPAVRLRSTYQGQAATARIRNAGLVTTGDYQYAIDLRAPGAAVDLEDTTVSATGLEGRGIQLVDANTAFSANRFAIAASHVGIDSRAGKVTLNQGTVATRIAHGHALYVSREIGDSATLEANAVQIETSGSGAMGALARLSGARIHLQDSSVVTRGADAKGLAAMGVNARLSARNVSVITSGARAEGLFLSDGADVLLDNTRLDVMGSGAPGIRSMDNAPGARNNLVLKNGSRITTRDGAALRIAGGNHVLTLENATVTASAGGQENTGILLHSSALPVIDLGGGSPTMVESRQIRLSVARSVLTGDIMINSGAADVSLRDGSVLIGAVIQRDKGRVNSLTLDKSSAWHVRNDSMLRELNNDGTVLFATPAQSGEFKTLTVNNYSGGGTLVLKTRLGDDASPTDRLVIDGGAASGGTALRILNAGGAGGQTQRGIRVVATINGAVTTQDAFRLDAGSSGYRASSATLALNGYDYSLVRGGNGGAASDWYLKSDGGSQPPVIPPVIPPVVPPVIPPVVPPDPPPKPPVTPPEVVLPPPPPDARNVSPESGAYAGNLLASMQLFAHGLHDRASDEAGEQQDTGERRLWTRISGRHDSGLRMAEGRVDIDTDAAVLQLGADLLRMPAGQAAAMYAGLMGGYGDARIRSTSSLRLPGALSSMQVRARGKVSGHAAGAYLTYYSNDATRLGAYADVWMQYGRYSNQIISELGTARYRSDLWSASLESGYALMPFPAGSPLGGLVVEPAAQLVYGRYQARDATLQGTLMQNGNHKTWNSRVGVRLYPRAAAGAATAALQPFLEANWLRDGGSASVRMGDSTLDAASARNAFELKLGAEGRLGNALRLSGHIFGKLGSGDQRGYGGTLRADYRW